MVRRPNTPERCQIENRTETETVLATHLSPLFAFVPLAVRRRGPDMLVGFQVTPQVKVATYMMTISAISPSRTLYQTKTMTYLTTSHYINTSSQISDRFKQSSRRARGRSSTPAVIHLSPGLGALIHPIITSFLILLNVPSTCLLLFTQLQK